jgi:hypothetical protein
MTPKDHESEDGESRQTRPVVTCCINHSLTLNSVTVPLTLSSSAKKLNESGTYNLSHGAVRHSQSRALNRLDARALDSKHSDK